VKAYLIPLGDGSAHAFVDFEDWRVLKKYPWYLDCLGYPATTWNSERVRMHTIIMQPPPGLVVDHINRNPLDNRRKNLRIVPQLVNARSHGLARKNTSGFTGVSIATNGNSDKWRAYITINNRQKFLGHFPTKEKAWFARLRAEVKYWKMKITICEVCLQILCREPSENPQIERDICYNCKAKVLAEADGQDPTFSDGGRISFLLCLLPVLLEGVIWKI